MNYVVLLVCFVMYLQSRVSSYYEEFDYFKLSMVWVPSLCNGNGCAVLPVSAKFSIHGLWPANFANTEREIFPTYCSRKKPYQMMEDPDLYAMMNIYWPNLLSGRKFNQRLWKFNWDKHGTCSLIWYFQVEYFKLAVERFNDFDVLAHLLEKGIEPANDHTYSVERIRLGVKELTTKEPDLYCNRNNEEQWQLIEIRLCYTPGGEIDDCEPLSLKHTCFGKVLFPAISDPPGLSK